MKSYKDFIIKTTIITIAVLIIIQVALSPLKKTIRIGENVLDKIEIYEKRIKDSEFLIIYHKILLNNLKEFVYYLAESEGISPEERIKIQNSIIKIINRDIRPILESNTN
ncbi:hypothetical protein N9U83_04350 [Candidatus Pelagibacter sp.]|nr:hypothetical protein [Candidatus Pelagibacter sp.]